MLREWLGRLFGPRPYVPPSTEDLIRCLLDKRIDLGGRDDCAMALEYSDDPEAEAALGTVALDPETEPILAETVAESLATIWVRQNRLDEALLRQLSGEALLAARNMIGALRPEWLSRLPGSAQP